MGKDVQNDIVQTILLAIVINNLVEGISIDVDSISIDGDRIVLIITPLMVIQKDVEANVNIYKDVGIINEGRNFPFYVLADRDQENVVKDSNRKGNDPFVGSNIKLIVVVYLLDSYRDMDVLVRNVATVKVVVNVINDEDPEASENLLPANLPKVIMLEDHGTIPVVL